MKQQNILSILFLFFFFTLWSQEHFPGGVAGAEAWYIADYQDIDLGEFNNEAYPNRRINSCLGAFSKTLVNFNHALGSDKLCLYYTAALENTTSRNIFFVGEPKVANTALSHVMTDWSPVLANLSQTDSIIRNRFDLSNGNSYVNKQATAFGSISNANINFYHWNIYQTDKKFKSFGYDGETTFYIGKEFDNDLTTGAYFDGNFPEFISYPFELTANQKNRVESYLALKYGITLDNTQSYRSAKNVVFWNKSNNTLFKDRIFGIGRDDISGLNQLQSESIHFKDYLVASVGGGALQTNKEKQEQVSISDNNFIVFGDNGQPDGLNALNQFNVGTLKKVWLSQNTEKNSRSIHMFFKLNLETILKQTLFNDPTLKIWMLHDKYVTNQEESNFNSNYVDYYETSQMDGFQYAHFRDVLFDVDENTYDQFTFGIGPQMIVQARFRPDCNEGRLDTDIVITGGRAPYDVVIQNNNGYNDTQTISNNTLFLVAESPYTYTVNVTDSADNTAEVTFDAIQYPMSLELGPPIILSASQQQATVNAGLGVTDPDATYEWFLDDIPLLVYTPTITVTQPGEYKVIVTSGNRACIKEDAVKVYYNFIGTAVQPIDCNLNAATINLNISGGIPPFTTIISSTNQTVSQVHNTTSYVFNNIPFGQATVTTTDSNGSVFQELLTLEDPMQGIELDLLSQLQQLCSVTYQSGIPHPIINCQNDFTLDASTLVNPNANVDYEWYRNGSLLAINGPIVEIDDEGTSTSQALRIYMVKIINLDNGCSITESFAAKPYYRMHDANSVFEEELQSMTEANNTTDSYIKTRLHPNPSETNTTFYYEVYSSEKFDGTVKIFTVTGSLVQQVEISGESSYKLPFELLTAGVYFVCTSTNGKLLTDKIIIK